MPTSVRVMNGMLGSITSVGFKTIDPLCTVYSITFLRVDYSGLGSRNMPTIG